MNRERRFLLVIFSIIAGLAFVMSSCLDRVSAKQCEGPRPTVTHLRGHHVTLLSTGEHARIITEWAYIGNPCRYRHPTTYTIRLDDGAELNVYFNDIEDV